MPAQNPQREKSGQLIYLTYSLSKRGDWQGLKGTQPFYGGKKPSYWNETAVLSVPSSTQGHSLEGKDSPDASHGGRGSRVPRGGWQDMAALSKLSGKIQIGKFELGS